MDDTAKTTPTEDERTRTLATIANVVRELARRVEEGERAARALRDIHRQLTAIAGGVA